MSPLLDSACGAASVLLCLLVVSLQAALFVTVARSPGFFRLAKPSLSLDATSRDRAGNLACCRLNLESWRDAACVTGAPTRGNAQKAGGEERPARLSACRQAGARAGPRLESRCSVLFGYFNKELRA